MIDSWGPEHNAVLQGASLQEKDTFSIQRHFSEDTDMTYGIHFCESTDTLVMSRWSELLFAAPYSSSRQPYKVIEPKEGEAGYWSGLVTEDGGDIYIAGGHSGEVIKFDRYGKEMMRFPFRSDPACYVSLGEPVMNDCPEDVAIDEDRNLYVCCGEDYLAHAVQKFSPDGHYLLSFDASHLPESKFACPHAVVYALGMIYVADSHRGAILLYDRDGQFVGHFKTKCARQPTDLQDFFLREDGSLVAAWGDTTIGIFSPEGKLLREIAPSDGPPHIESVASGRNGDIFVLSKDGDMLSMYDMNGTLCWDLDIEGEKPASEPMSSEN